MPAPEPSSALGTDRVADAHQIRPEPRVSGDPLPAGRHGLSRETVETSQRDRLMAAMIDATNEVGYARVTVEDLARRARTAKRTFYELFATKEACLIETYESVMTRVLERVALVVAEYNDPYERVSQGVTASLVAMAEMPAAIRFSLIECTGATPELTAHRKAIIELFAQAIWTWHEESRLVWPELLPLSPNAPVAIVGAIMEPINMRILMGQAAALDDMAEELSAIVNAMMFDNRR